MKIIFDFLIRKFVKNYENVNSQNVRQAYGALGGVVGVIINSLILIIELIIGLFLNSIAVTADAIHNLTDAVSSVITIISFRLANRPADDKHPFGYGRVEYLTALLFSAAILLVGFEFLKSSFIRILHPVNIHYNPASFFCMLLALPLQIFLNRFTNYLGKITNSSALQASAMESFTDILVLSMVVFSLLVIRFTSIPIDGYAGLIVSFFILHSGLELGKDTVDTILGKVPDPGFVEDLKRSILTYPLIIGVHDLVIHNYGPGRYMASIHAEVPYNVPVMQLHDTIDRAEKEVGERMNLHLSIHMDPVKNDSPEVMGLKKQIDELVRKIPGILSMHDFRVVGDSDEKTLIFDVVADKSSVAQGRESYLKSKIQEEVQNISQEYRCIITIDREYH